MFRITEDQLEKVRDVAAWARDVETRLSAEQKRSSELTDQNAASRQTALSAAARIEQLELDLAAEQKRSAMLLQQIAEIEPVAASAQQLKIKLVEEEERSAVLSQRIAEIEPAAACAEKMADIIEEIVKLGPKPRL